MSALLILALLALPIGLYVAPHLLQGLAFAWGAQQLLGWQLDWVEYSHAFVGYAAAYLALQRYLPRTARVVGVLLCAAWAGLGVTVAVAHEHEMPLLRGPMGLLLCAVAGGAIGSWANFRHPGAFFLVLEHLVSRVFRRGPRRTARINSKRQDRPPQSPPPSGGGARDPWTVLGVKRDATPEQIRAAYLEQMRQYHEFSTLAEERAKEINRAYELLGGRR